MVNLYQFFDSVADSGYRLLSKTKTQLQQVTDRGSESNQELSIQELSNAILSNRGKALGAALAREVVKVYRGLNDEQRMAFFQYLLTEHGVDSENVIRCSEAYQKDPSFANHQALSQAVEAPRQEFFRRVNMAPGGTRSIVNMRTDLLQMIEEKPEWRAVDADMRHLLYSWFNPGFLTLTRIDWQTPAQILEKLIQYEAVHTIKGWDDLKHRLSGNRACYAFFHPALPDDPLIFVEVAFVRGLADAIPPLLAQDEVQDDIKQMDTAIFYSISNCQEGLQGISFGNFLIKQVVLELRKDLPHLKLFSTLSPIPGFMHWLNKERDNANSTLLTEEYRTVLSLLDDPEWHSDPAKETALHPVLMSLCAHYLYHTKRGDRPLDAVARFHLGNGAIMERLNWSGDTSAQGLKQSAGILVNYRYELSSVEQNHESYVNEGQVVTSKTFFDELSRFDV